MINKYDEFGIPASTNGARFGYTGQSWLPELGVNYYKARMYSPTLGRFMQSDPIGYGDGMNMYNYVGSDPVNKVDPTGLAGTVTCITVYYPSSSYLLGYAPATLSRQECPFTGEGPGSNLPPAPPSPPGPPGGLPQNGKRGLTPREKRILMCNGASQAAVDTFSLSSGLPVPFNLNSRVDGVTLSPIAGISVANLRDGIGEMTSSRGQYGLIAHEFAHHIQYRQGMTLSSYLADTWKNGYQDSMYETIARDFSKTVVDNWDNGKCR